MSADLPARFDAAVADSKTLPERPDNATMLKLYALYKQASEGDTTDERPGVTDFIARAKWDAWHECHGQQREVAMQHYVDLVESLK